MPLPVHQSNKYLKQGRWILLAVVVGLWLIIGYQKSFIYQNIVIIYQKLFSFLQLPDDTFEALAGNNSSLVTMSFWLIYCGFGLLIVQLYFMNWTTSKIALGLYVCLFLTILLINETGKILDLRPFRIIAYRLITLMVSPMPVILLIPALHLTKPVKKGVEEPLSTKPTPNQEEKKIVNLP